MNHKRLTTWPRRGCAWLNLGFLLALLAIGCDKRAERVVVYCAQDQEFADGVFKQFQARAGLTPATHYDTEATKSVSLYQEIVQEAARPRCDVFWNNEILSTIRLQRRGLLEPYSSPSAADYPDSTHPADRSWQAFAARARVLIVNTDRLPAKDQPHSLLDLTDAKYKGQVAMAKPNFGTTATHAACLFEVLGRDAARKWFLGLRENGVHLLD